MRVPKFVLFGTPRFAAIVLERLITANFAPMALITNPDKPAGRKQVLTPPPVKVLGEKHALPVFQPHTLTDPDFTTSLKSIGADLFVVAAYGKIIPGEILSLPPHGSLGIHPSLLPKFRGASPIQSALLEDERKTGVSLYVMDEQVDHGPVAAVRETTLPETIDYEATEKILAELGAALFMASVADYLEGSIKPITQDESQATFTKKFKTDDGFVEPSELIKAMDGATPAAATKIFRKIKALNPEPGVWTLEQDKRKKLLDAEMRDGRLVLTLIQWEGKKPQPVV